MAGIILAAAEMGMSYAFPQVGVALKSVRVLKTTYDIGKIVVSYATGDIISGASAVANLGPDLFKCSAAKGVCYEGCRYASTPLYRICSDKCESMFRRCLGLA